jgi:hypothetical protein
MKSFEHDYLLDTPISHQLLSSVRMLGEYRGRQRLYQEQSPEVLDTLKRAAIIQSTESSNRIEGITAEHGRIEKLVFEKAKPHDRPEQEITGYRDVLNAIHVNHDRMKLTPDLLLGWHATLAKYTKEKGGIWKPKDNAIFEVRPDGRAKESYYEALNKSSQKWHEGGHDLRPWWNYFVGMLTAAYKEFEERVGTITSARGAKRQMVVHAIQRINGRFTIADLRRACPGVSYPTLQRALFDLRREKVIRCLGRGPDAQWEKTG